MWTIYLLFLSSSFFFFFDKFCCIISGHMIELPSSSAVLMPISILLSVIMTRTLSRLVRDLKVDANDSIQYLGSLWNLNGYCFSDE